MVDYLFRTLSYFSGYGIRSYFASGKPNLFIVLILKIFFAEGGQCDSMLMLLALGYYVYALAVHLYFRIYYRVEWSKNYIQSAIIL